MDSSDEDEVPVVVLDDSDYYSEPTTTKVRLPQKVQKTRRRKKERHLVDIPLVPAAPATPAAPPAAAPATSIPPIFQLIGSITGRATDIYKSWTTKSGWEGAGSRRGSAATTVTSSTSYQTPKMKEMSLPPLPPLSVREMTVPINAPPTPPGDHLMSQAMDGTSHVTSPTKSDVVPTTSHMTNLKLHATGHVTRALAAFLGSPPMIAVAVILFGLLVTLGRPLLEIYIHKGIHYTFNLIFYATVLVAAATVCWVAYLLISKKMSKPKLTVDVQAAQAVTSVPPASAPLEKVTPLDPQVSRKSSRRRSKRSTHEEPPYEHESAPGSRRVSNATSAGSNPMSRGMMGGVPHGYYQQQWDEYNNYPMNMNNMAGMNNMNNMNNMNSMGYMNAPVSPMYQPQLYHPVPVRPFEAPATPISAPPPEPVLPTPPQLPKHASPLGHARTESGSVAQIPDVLQAKKSLPQMKLKPSQPKQPLVYRFVQRTVEQPREHRRTRDLPPIPQTPTIQGHATQSRERDSRNQPAVFTRFEDENSMVNYSSAISEVDLKVGDHSFKPYGSPPRRYRGMNV